MTRAFQELNPIIHAPIRLAIMTVLVSVKSAEFSYLKEATGATDGNLSVHLSRLEKAGYIKQTKSFRDKKPLTNCAVTPAGRREYEKYVTVLSQYVEKDR